MSSWPRIIPDQPSRCETTSKLHLNYTSPDKNQCSIVDGDVYLLWTGPYANGKAAIQICNKLGWKTARDNDYCYGRTIDKDHKGKKRIRPDGVPW
jgi:hypothetical protein